MIDGGTARAPAPVQERTLTETTQLIPATVDSDVLSLDVEAGAALAEWRVGSGMNDGAAWFVAVRVPPHQRRRLAFPDPLPVRALRLIGRGRGARATVRYQVTGVTR